MPRPSDRWIALGLSTAACAAALLVFLEWRERTSADPDLTIAEGDLEGARRALETAPAPDGDAPWSRYPFHLPEEVARKLLPELQSERARYDPYCGYIYVAGFHQRRDWEEHPAGFYEKRTNSLGLVRATEIADAKPDLRVLVTGDSHVDGVCSLDESFPALLEASLSARLPDESVEVLNAGVSGYSCFQYLGTLERFAQAGLAPDVFVVTVFGGNDFSGLLHLWRFFELDLAVPAEGAALQEQPDRQGIERAKQQRLQRKAPREFVPPYGQALSSVSYFYSFPDDARVALDAACELTERIRDRCAQLDTKLLVVFLPSPSELPGQCDHARIRAAAEYAGLGDADLARLTSLRTDYVERVTELGVAILDLQPIFAQHAGELFWKRDLHLDLEGQRVTAEAVEPRLLELLER